MHGTTYVRSHLQGRTTGCYVDQSKLKIHEDTPITSYYLWLPYLLSLLYALAKLPHSLWKRYFENNLISSIIGGIAGGEQGKDVTNGDTNTVGGNEEGEGEGDGKRGQNQSQQQGKKKGNQNNKNNQQLKVTPRVMVNSFEEFQHKYASYQRNFLFLESLNMVTLLISIEVRKIS